MHGHGLLMRSANGAEWLQVSDATVSVLLPSAPLSKRDLELIQVKCYQALAKSKKVDLSFDILEHLDKPDFWIGRNGQKVGLDVAAFAFTERREAAAQFRLIKNRLRDAYRAGRLRQCQSINVNLAFKTDFIPHPEKIERAIAELTDILEGLQPDPQLWSTLDGSKWVLGKTPNPFPMGESGRTSDGNIEWYVTGNTLPNNSFSIECGFNLEHQYMGTATSMDVKQRLDEIIAQHDKPNQQIDELVIIAGGPDKNGDAVFDEALIASVFVEHWKGKIQPPKNARRVVLLNWGANTLHVLHELT